ncbi:MAG: hypothetical protein RR573_02600 [Oscillospiraceae bacterium]
MFDDVNETDVTEQEVVQPAQDTQAADSGEEAQAPEQAEEQAQAPEQSAQENAHFADMRRKQELDEARASLAAEKLRAAQMEQTEAKLSAALKKIGYEGSAEEIADRVEAEKSGRSLEQVRTARETEEKEQNRLQEKENELNRTAQELEIYKKREAEREFTADLAEIQKLDPKIKRLEDLGRDFIILRANGVANIAAYNAIKESLKPIAKSTGAVGSAATGESEYFTREEVAAMSQREVDKNYEKIRKSQTKWKITN